VRSRLSSRYRIVGVLGDMNYLQPIARASAETPSVSVHYGEAGAPASVNRPDFRARRRPQHPHSHYTPNLWG
jgi:hypothetical protein